MDIIFGGNGFIGSHLQQLIPSISLDINSNGDNYCDVRKPIKNAVPIDSSTVIYNLAAIHRTPGHESSEYFHTNVLGAENVCDYARKRGINIIVFTSSIAPYAASEELKTEETLPMPNTPYGISKYIAEEIHKRWQAENPHDRTLIILRPGVVFGSRENGNFTRLYSSLRKRVFFYPGRKDTLKSAIYVKDLVNIMIQMVKKEKPGVHLYNMCFVQPHSIEEIVRTISKITGVISKIPRIPGGILKAIAITTYGIARFFGKKLIGIHPDRVSKLMTSTNISGRKIHEAGYLFNYNLEESIKHWYDENDKMGLR